MTRDYDWSTRRTAYISDCEFYGICEDYEEHKKEMTEEEAWWEALSTVLLNQDIDADEIPYVIVAQMLKDCKTYYKNSYKQ